MLLGKTLRGRAKQRDQATMRRRISAMLLLAVACMARGADAQPAADDLQIHGFVSQGYIKTTRNNYLGPTARPGGSFEFTEVGVNFTKPIGDRLRVAMQIFAHDLGPLGKY